MDDDPFARLRSQVFGLKTQISELTYEQSRL